MPKWFIVGCFVGAAAATYAFQLRRPERVSTNERSDRMGQSASGGHDTSSASAGKRL
jgi:hypothetical protein